MHVKFVFVGYINGLLNEGNARLYNGHGERFMWRYFPDRGEKKHSSEEIVPPHQPGDRGGAGRRPRRHLFRCQRCSGPFRSNDRYRRMYELADRAGMDLRRQPIELVTYPHDLVGGIRIDECGRTNVPGLYAAGEASGGSHGASRFGGSACRTAWFTERRAARSAAARAALSRPRPA